MQQDSFQDMLNSIGIEDIEDLWADIEDLTSEIIVFTDVST